MWWKCFIFPTKHHWNFVKIFEQKSYSNLKFLFWPRGWKLQDLIAQRLEVIETYNFGFFNFLYDQASVPNFIKIWFGHFRFFQKVVDLAWNDPIILFHFLLCRKRRKLHIIFESENAKNGLKVALVWVNNDSPESHLI